jgi:hypothetical protein
MRNFKIPYEFEHEEIWFWGLSLRQIIYVLSTLLIFPFLFLPLNIIAKIFFSLFWIAFAVSAAFVKVGKLFFDKFLIVFFKYFFKQKRYKYVR